MINFKKITFLVLAAVIAGGAIFYACTKDTEPTKTEEITSVKHQKAVYCSSHVITLQPGFCIYITVCCSDQGHDMDGSYYFVNCNDPNHHPITYPGYTFIDPNNPGTFHITHHNSLDPNKWTLGCGGSCMNGNDVAFISKYLTEIAKELIANMNDPNLLPCLR